VVVVLCNAPPDEAPRLARTVVEERLAACVNVIPGVRSFYVWEGRVCDEGESTLVIKLTTEGVERLSQRLRALHSYDTPEIVVLPVDTEASDAAYVSWVRDSTTA
jgi:periplasmic divalent cation tolerance protein